MPSILKFDQWQTTAGANVPTVIQVVSAADTSYRSVALGGDSTADWVSATITRKFTTSKILVTFTGGWGTNSTIDTSVRLYSSLDGYIGGGSDTGNSRDVSSIVSPGTDKGYGQTAGSGTYSLLPAAFTYLYTPSNVTSTITLTVRIWVESACTVYPNGDGWRGTGQQAHNVGAQLVLMEVGT